MYPHQKINDHYTVGSLLDEILRILAGMGKDLNRLRPRDLAPVDEFHVRGREAAFSTWAAAWGGRRDTWRMNTSAGHGD